MRLFHLCADRGIPPDGSKGASVHLRSLATAMARRHEVTLFCARSPEAGASLPVAVEPLKGSASVLAAAHRRGVPDVIYERYSLGHRAGLEAARAMGRPFVLEVNAPLVAEAERHRPGTVDPGDVDTERELFREADLVVVVSNPLRQHVARTRGTRPTVVVPNGCAPDLFAQRLPADPRPTIGFLGHPKPWHGADRLGVVLGELRRAGHDVRLLVVGGGPGADAVRDAAGAAGVADHVEITGALAQADAVAAIARAWVGVAPYRPHPFFYFCPIKVVEYLAAGLPVVASAVGDVPELVGDAGVVVPPDDLGAFVVAIANLLEDTEQRRVVGERGRQRMLRERTWDAAAEETLAALDVAIGRSVARGLRR